MNQQIHIIRANRLTHFVRDAGPKEGPVAVLLHGFPDTADLWSGVAPALIKAGYRIIAPDLRGFGRTDMPARVADYDIFGGAIPDIIALLDALEIERAHVAGHDFGAAVAWGLAALHPDRFNTLTAISVGHPRAFLAAGASQKLMSWYIALHQLRGLCEAAYRFGDWRFFRHHWAGHGDIDATIAMLARPGRLAAGLNWYRANVSFARILNPPPIGALGEEIVRIPTMGIWGDGDKYLGEPQMTGSAAFIEAPWRYERIDGAGHWVMRDAASSLAALLASHWSGR
jgi:pimeloyl-ACP methyl ester carboxylesterase